MGRADNGGGATLSMTDPVSKSEFDRRLVASLQLVGLGCLLVMLFFAGIFLVVLGLGVLFFGLSLF